MDHLVSSKSERSHRTVIMVSVVVILFSLGIVWSAWDQRRAAWTDASLRSREVAVALSRAIALSIEARDVALLAAAGTMATPAFTTMDPGLRHQLLFRGALPGRDDYAIVLLNDHGEVIDRSDDAIPADMSQLDQDWSRLRNYQTADGLFISQPYQSRLTHEWFMALGRRVSSPTGSPAGVVLQPIRISSFTQLVSALHLTTGMTTQILTEDGSVLSSTGTDRPAAIPGFANALAMARLHAQPFSGTTDQAGTPAMFAVQFVDDLPLALSVTITLSNVYAEWQTRTVVTIVASLLLIVVTTLLVRLMARQQDRLHQAELREAERAEQARKEAERLHAARMEAVSRLTAGVAHDFNNHMQTITSSLEIISADYLSEPEARDIAQIAYKAANEGAKLTHRLLTFSRQQVLQPRRVNVSFLLNDIRKLIFDARIFEAPIDCRIIIDEPVKDLHVDLDQVESCLLNLLLNAREAMPQGGMLYLEARNATPEDELFGALTPGRHVILTVRDSGRGMDEITRTHAFEPFFTTKPFGHGAGLGLSTAQGFCHQSGGDIRILDNRDQPGTTIELWLPAALPTQPDQDEVQFNYATIGRPTARLLLVEHERDVLMALSAILVGGGFEVVSAHNGAEGLMRLHNREPYDAVLTAQSMPDMTGTEFLARLATDMPALPMLILTGGELSEESLSSLPKTVQLLHKPIRRTNLLNAVREAIGRASHTPQDTRSNATV